jgi:hypothetical protein
VFIIYLQQRVLIAVSNGSLVITVKLKVNEHFQRDVLHSAEKLPLHILHSFRRSVFTNHFKAFILSDTTVVPTAVPVHNKNVKAGYRYYNGTSL